MESPKHKRRSSEQWQDMVRQYHESGLRAKEFCELNSLVLGTFRKYLYKKADYSNVSIQ